MNVCIKLMASIASLTGCLISVLSIYGCNRGDSGLSQTENKTSTLKFSDLKKRLIESDSKTGQSVTALEIASFGVKYIPELSEMAASASDKERYAAALALRQVSDPSASVPLRRLATDKSSKVRNLALAALVERNDEEAMSLCLNFIVSPEYDSSIGIKALARLRSGNASSDIALKVIEEYASRGDDSHKIDSIRALRHLDGARLKPMLLKLMTGKDSLITAEAGIVFLEKFPEASADRRVESKLMSLWPQFSELDQMRLAQCAVLGNGPARPIIIESALVRGSPLVLNYVAQELKDSDTITPEILVGLIGNRDIDELTKCNLIDAVGRISQQIPADVWSILLKSRSERVLERVCLAIGSRREISMKDKVNEIAQNSTGDRHIAASIGLSYLGVDQPELSNDLATMASSKDPHVRQRAASWLILCKTNWASPILKKLKNDSDLQVRLTANKM